MTTKLTLSVDESIAQRAKTVAKARNTSVSAMLSQFVAGLDALERRSDSFPIAPITLAATGLARGCTDPGKILDLGSDTGVDEKLLEEALWERYGSIE
jgi:hypothetical protein